MATASAERASAARAPLSRRLRYRLREWAAAHGGRAFLWALRFNSRHRGRLLGPHTECVIEGFPRSANTFAVVAFRLAQGRSVAIAHHTHAAAQVIEGLRRDVPVLLLVREPLDAVTSLLIRLPFVTPRQGLADYVRFHRKLERHLPRCAVAPFEEVISDFGRSMRRLNRLWGTDFAEFEPTPDNFEACRREIDASERRDSGGEVRPTHVPRPSPEREQRKEELRRWVERPELRATRREAERLFRLFREAAQR